MTRSKQTDDVVFVGFPLLIEDRSYIVEETLLIENLNCLLEVSVFQNRGGFSFGLLVDRVYVDGRRLLETLFEGFLVLLIGAKPTEFPSYPMRCDRGSQTLLFVFQSFKDLPSSANVRREHRLRKNRPRKKA